MHYWSCWSVNCYQYCQIWVFSCPQQLNRWPCHWLTDSLTHWLSHSTFTFDIKRATQDTCDLWNIWSEWWGDLTWPTHWSRQIKRQRQWQRQIHLENIFKEQSHVLVTFGTFDQRGDMTWLNKLQRQRQRQRHLENTFK